MIRRAVLIAMALSELGCVPGPCSHAGCFTGATIDILLSPDVVVTDASVSVCRNQRCSDARLTDQGGNIYSLVGQVSGHAVVWQEPGRIRIEVQTTASAGLSDGDRYTITMRAADGTLLATDEFTAQYTRFYPNGEDCDDSPCLQVRRETQGL